MSNFQKAFNWVIGAEGGYTYDLDDPGGETNWGISKRAYPNVNIARLTKDQAEVIYARDYWNRCRCDEFPVEIGIALFDAAVNQGAFVGAQLLQRALGVYQDGIVGPETISAAKRVPPGDLLIDFLSHRAVRYADGVPKFRRGWFARLFRLQRAIGATV